MTALLPGEQANASGSGGGMIPPVLLAQARQARQLRATMSAFLPSGLLVDPAWDMMLDLFIAAGVGEQLRVKDLILLSGESPASAMRRIDRLQEADLLIRHADPDDHRRVRIGLTAKGHNAMAAMLANLFDMGEDTKATAPTPRSFRPDPLDPAARDDP